MENIQDLDSSLQSIGHDYSKLSDNVKVYLNQIYDYKIDITNQLDESLSELQVKSRLLCKMLYNVFTISTYQN
ncbi:hypothetical protein OZ415_08810 [Aerococcus urinaeequi]|uniref:Uncharacterized protein n=1 Tax=Aerococcus urinaeequi TaxID=51665 RepID=A0AA47G8M6_9LACT|nr:hypothetical protein [Aerococcus urinaeequi]WAT24332.1 hypothetical protein OZ415_08810 [Aerococcus urinaeequi]